MSDGLDIDARRARFRERATAVRKRNLPAAGGGERQMFIKQAEQDSMDSPPPSPSPSSPTPGRRWTASSH